MALTECPPGGYDLIVMDPPFPNTSAARGQQYGTLDLYDLFQLPIRDLLAPCAATSNGRPGGLLCCWITNRPRIRRVMLERLFPAWGVTFVAEWYWLKLTRKGEPVLPMGSQHRKPFERLLIARRTPANAPLATATPDIPARHVFASIQCTLHSRKPPLDGTYAQDRPCCRICSRTTLTLMPLELLKDYLPAADGPPQCLELFARSLTPGWTSWGNEPLKFQSTDYFVPAGHTIP
ncbi:MT-A70-domain-containing protein [Syncephalis pseudoplumigaleata]|uniref:MT-A70-domain-containing protein n=1 Tax=Syncephalis pseudoplumigaleata TaxID=1712513 RepID=A0A4P9Z2E3_9FUNG|nr:MT-A70-domain-containing protein [Syncephalis pseudoplumigaleata]|eukprot:RKP26697.1 MT-A70-domain-containing protein [Syncephalis pseudoplumigaleata]